MKLNLSFLLLLLVFSSCANRSLTYFNDLKDESLYSEQVNVVASEPLVQPGDLLDITVTSLNPEANILFNRGVMAPSSNATGTSTTGTEGYLVDKQGNIDFPVLGAFQVGGLNKMEIKSKLIDRLKQYLKDPIVNVRYMNYRITVVGEVNKPSTIMVPAEQINIIEALGMAGDLTVYGKRENVLVIRQVNGVRTMARLNLNTKEVLNSPYFYLQPNDVVYVEPVKNKLELASTWRQNTALAISVVTLISVLLYRFL